MRKIFPRAMCAIIPLMALFALALSLTACAVSTPPPSRDERKKQQQAVEATPPNPQPTTRPVSPLLAGYDHFVFLRSNRIAKRGITIDAAVVATFGGGEVHLREYPLSDFGHTAQILAVGGNRLYIERQSKILALDLATGRIAQLASTTNPPFRAGGIVYFAAGGRIEAIDPRSGELLSWPNYFDAPYKIAVAPNQKRLAWTRTVRSERSPVAYSVHILDLVAGKPDKVGDPFLWLGSVPRFPNCPPVGWIDDNHLLTIRTQVPPENILKNGFKLSGLADHLVAVDLTTRKAADVAPLQRSMMDHEFVTVPGAGLVMLVNPGSNVAASFRIDLKTHKPLDGPIQLGNFTTLTIRGQNEVGAFFVDELTHHSQVTVAKDPRVIVAPATTDHSRSGSGDSPILDELMQRSRVVARNTYVFVSPDATRLLWGGGGGLWYLDDKGIARQITALVSVASGIWCRADDLLADASEGRKPSLTTVARNGLPATEKNIAEPQDHVPAGQALAGLGKERMDVNEGHGKATKLQPMTSPAEPKAQRAARLIQTFNEVRSLQEKSKFREAAAQVEHALDIDPQFPPFLMMREALSGVNASLAQAATQPNGLWDDAARGSQVQNLLRRAKDLSREKKYDSAHLFIDQMILIEPGSQAGFMMRDIIEHQKNRDRRDVLQKERSVALVASLRPICPGIPYSDSVSPQPVDMGSGLRDLNTEEQENSNNKLTERERFARWVNELLDSAE